VEYLEGSERKKKKCYFPLGSLTGRDPSSGKELTDLGEMKVT